MDKTCVLHRKGKSGKIGTEKLGEDLPMLKEIQEQTNRAVKELCELARLKRGDLMVVGCSSSEVAEKGWNRFPAGNCRCYLGRAVSFFKGAGDRSGCSML